MAACDSAMLMSLIGVAGPWVTHREVVRVSPISSHTPLRPQPADLPTPVTSPLVPNPVAGPHSSADVDVDVEYTCGCPRGHTSRLSIPVLPPFRWELHSWQRLCKHKCRRCPGVSWYKACRVERRQSLHAFICLVNSEPLEAVAGDDYLSHPCV